MNINPSVAPYVCLKFPLPVGEGMNILIDRRWQLVEAFLNYSSLTSLEDKELEEQATFNALVMLIGGFFGEKILEGRDAKVMWHHFGIGVQETIRLYAEEDKD